MAGVVIDTSVLLDFLSGIPSQSLTRAVLQGHAVLPPLVVAETVSGEMAPEERFALGEVLQDVPLHLTSLTHWIDVGQLRRQLRRKGVNVTLADAHVAQCALDLDAVLLTRDAIFTEIARHTALRVTSAAS